MHGSMRVYAYNGVDVCVRMATMRSAINARCERQISRCDGLLNLRYTLTLCKLEIEAAPSSVQIFILKSEK